MEQQYFYFTITDDSHTYDAHAIADQLGMPHIQAFNRGDAVEQNYVATQMFLRYLPDYDIQVLDYMFNKNHVSKFLSLPQALQKTLHFVANGNWAKYSYGGYLDGALLKNLALMQANFVFHAQLHFPKVSNEYPFIQHTPSSVKNKPLEDIAYLSIYSYRNTVDEISRQLGMDANYRSFNVGDKIGESERLRKFTLWRYKYRQTGPTEILLSSRLNALVNDLYQNKEKILTLGNELDIDMGLTVSGSMPDDCEFVIAIETIEKMAQMRLSLDFNMYFTNNL